MSKDFLLHNSAVPMKEMVRAAINKHPSNKRYLKMLKKRRKPEHQSRSPPHRDELRSYMEQTPCGAGDHQAHLGGGDADLGGPPKAQEERGIEREDLLVGLSCDESCKKELPRHIAGGEQQVVELNEQELVYGEVGVL